MTKRPSLNLARVVATAVAAITPVASLAADWKPAPGPLMTRWAKEVAPNNALPDYPRPQLVRPDWQNLNGLWDYAVVGKDDPQPAPWQGQILVPYPIESALSGVGKRVTENDRIWYRRTFRVPDGWNGRRVLLHFGAVDFEAAVRVNGKEIGTHHGGYDEFSFDITDALQSGADQELVVSAWDPTDAGHQARGKQVRKPEGIWYTPTSGIWQTVWIEPVAPTYIERLVITPQLDDGAVIVQTHARLTGANPGATPLTAKVEILEGGQVVQWAKLTDSKPGATCSPRISLKVPNAKPWSPDQPHLYDLRVTLLANDQPVDQVGSYFGLRKIALGRDAQGHFRLHLNNQPLFQFGPLDQGFWPDGLYTAPTDAALRYDIEMTKQLGFNLARKHVKVEPARWYYWCDKLGLLVWQDMPSGNFGGEDDQRRSDEASAQYELELRRLIDTHYNSPSIVMWVPFNEGWGQHETPRYAQLVKQLDPTRLVNNASGWTDRRAGDVLDIHNYPGPAVPRVPADQQRAGVLGEFGGLGLPLSGHTWQSEKNWGYRSYKNPEDLTDAYLRLIDRLHPMTGNAGLAAAVYTQTTDVEVEVNGLMTYDRALVKPDAKLITAANQSVYTPPPAGRVQTTRPAPPATPLVACDPYFSIWSFGDRLTDDATKHWTGRDHSLSSLIRVDGQTYRLMGPDPRRLPALPQSSLTVLPTRTIYTFEGASVRVTLTFLTAALPEDIDLLARPVTYLTWDVQSTDGQSHAVSLFFDSAAEITVNEGRQPVTGAREIAGPLVALKVGSRDQPILAKKGDDLRIDWGYLYTAAPVAASPQTAIIGHTTALADFVAHGRVTEVVDPRLPRAANDDPPVAAVSFDLGQVRSKPVSRWLMLAYDDLYSIQYMRKNLRPYWRRNGAEAVDLLTAAARDYASLVRRCGRFDAELMADLRRAGGDQYAALCALAYRQCFAAGKFVADANGQPLSFCKENFSNGCIATSDVFYPMAPQFLLFGPSVAKSFLVPFMNYAASDRWKFPFAPHDLGTYPQANGQVYGGGERTEENQMPVEESGNLLLLLGALSQMEGHTRFADTYWPVVERWAEYLKAKGFDPENQLCTDDFAGHLAHNVNLSVKAICGLGAFAQMCERRGDKAQAAEYRRTAEAFAARWVKEADDGDHFRLAFDRPGTWSQKYNLVWDRILGLNLFPPAVARKELDYYRKIQKRYGLPLDNRKDYAKLDWTLWTATLTGDRADFDALLAPIHTWLGETPTRVPLTDWYMTTDGRQVGFQARPVVGGVFIQMLHQPKLWKKWAKRDATRAANFAPMPKPPRIDTVVPTAREGEPVWRYTFSRPSADWFKPEFNAGGWREGKAGFGTRGTPSATVRTEWSTSDIWLRHEMVVPPGKLEDVQLLVHHDEDVQIYINGVLAASATGFTTDYDPLPLTPAGRAALKTGPNLIAVHCRQTGGGQYIDLGLVRMTAVP